MSIYKSKPAKRTGFISDIIGLIVFPIILIIAISEYIEDGNKLYFILLIFLFILEIVNFLNGIILRNSHYQIKDSLLIIKGLDVEKAVPLKDIKSIRRNFVLPYKVAFETNIGGRVKTSYFMGDSEDEFEGEKAVFFLCTTDHENVLLIETFDDEKQQKVFYGITPEREDELISEIRTSVNLKVISN